MPLLEVDDLSVSSSTARGPAEAVRGVSFALDRGGTLGIVGESGSRQDDDRARHARAAARAARARGRMRFDGRELLGLAEAELCRLRGDRIGDGLPGADDGAQSRCTAIGRQVAETLDAASRHERAEPRGGGDPPPRPRRHSRSRRAASMPIRISSPAASDSASPSPSRSPAGRTSSSPTSRPRRSTSPFSGRFSTSSPSSSKKRHGAADDLA